MKTLMPTDAWVIARTAVSPSEWDAARSSTVPSVPGSATAPAASSGTARRPVT